MKKIVFGLSLALLLLMGTGKVSAQITSTAVVSSQASLSGPLSIGSQGNDVTVLQQFLIAKGYLQATGPTGYYGNLTSAAVSAFQAANSLPQVGKVGPMTLAILNQQLEGTAQQIAVTQQQIGASNGMNTNGGTMEASLPTGCIAGDIYNPMTGILCSTPQSAIAGCAGANIYNTITGQLCYAPTTHQSQQSQQQSSSAIIESLPATVAQNQVTLNGTFLSDPSWGNGGGLTWFQYGTNTDASNPGNSTMANSTTWYSDGELPASMTKTLPIGALQSNTTYYFEACVSPFGTSVSKQCGQILSFTTGTTAYGTPTITVTNPIVGASWSGGNSYDINWTSQNISNGGVYVQLCPVSNLSSCASLISGLGYNPPISSGTIQGQVPTAGNTLTTPAEVKVTSNQNSSVYGYSGIINVYNFGGYGRG
jgi:peptidoglycan hydrolase-like protein with peptidoglycan-binding domain